MKTSDIVALVQGLNNIQASDRDLPRKLNYAIDLNLRKLAPVHASYQRQVHDILQKYARRDDKNRMVSAPSGGILLDDPEKYNEEMLQLHETEVDVDLHYVSMDLVPEAFPARLYAGIALIIREPSSEPVPLRAVQQGDA